MRPLPPNPMLKLSRNDRSIQHQLHEGLEVGGGTGQMLAHTRETITLRVWKNDTKAILSKHVCALSCRESLFYVIEEDQWSSKRQQ